MSIPSLKLTLLPKHTNPHGTIFGGVLLSYIDLAGAVEARSWLHRNEPKHAPKEWHDDLLVTVAMDKVVFKKPVFVGDLISFFANVINIGQSSIETKIKVEVERGKETIQVTEARATYVAVDDENRKSVKLWRLKTTERMES